VSTDGAMAEVQIGDGPWQETHGHLVARVTPGSVIVRGRRSGYTAEATAQIAAGAEQAITLQWTDDATPPHDAPKHLPPPHLVAPAPPATVSVAPAGPPGRTRRIAAIASAGGGVALIGAAFWLQHESNVHTALEVEVVQHGGDGTTEYDRALLDHRLALVGGGAAAIAVAAGAYLWFTAPRAHVQLTPLAGDHSVGLLFTGSF
jgi:hypothetical protein